MFQSRVAMTLVEHVQGSVGALGIFLAGDGAQPGSEHCVFGDAPAVCRNDLLVPGWDRDCKGESSGP